MDDPKWLFEQAVENHRKLIVSWRGVPGVRSERFEEAMKIRHCALSLVGEPIMYPKINEFLQYLHENGISSFLVTNAQFPDRIRSVGPVTQLYVSIDASTRDTLKKIDRPLFKDFWERYLASLEALKDKPMTRTTYRLTLVKGVNMDDIAEYAKLVLIGMPLLIEIKGVTFSGATKTSEMTMQHSPYHEEVKAFAEQLCKYLEGRYELACEHAHSCCILIADTRLKVNGKWHTWIDYDKFTSLVREYYASGGTKTFTFTDYMAETPAWAVYGAPEAGFSPEDRRYRKVKGANKQQQQQQPQPAVETAEDN